MSKNNKIIVRYPPSPTGKLHVGNARTAVFNFLFAKKNDGKLIVRMEDTDRERSKLEYEKDILDNLTWLGIEWEGEILKQSERTETYKTYLNKLIEEGKAYISKETEGPNKEVIRFKNPNKNITFTDLIRGEITVNTEDLGDFIIARNINEPVYHLAVVIDDFESNVSHVIRGDDGISNTPRQILIQEAIGAPRPQYAHVPLVLAKDKSKLSKRKHGEAVSLSYYKEKGFLPEALVNFLTLIGWNPGTEEEIFTLGELEQIFDLEKVGKSGGVFDEVKLRYINKAHLKKLPQEVIKEKITSIFKEKGLDIEAKVLERAFNTIVERIEVWSDLEEAIDNGEYTFLSENPEYDPEGLVWRKGTQEDAKKHLKHVLTLISEKPEFESVDTAKNIIWDYAEKEGKGDVLWPLRFALSGLEKSPDPFTLLYVLGINTAKTRIQKAMDML